MSRVLLSGGAGTVGAAIARRLLSDPAYEVRVSDRRAAPQWMREGCELHTGDLRLPKEARAATKGCTHVIHLAAVAGGDPDLPRQGRPRTLMQARGAVNSAVIGAAVEQQVERFVYVSSAAVFERASELPATEAHLVDCPAPVSAEGFSMLAGERCCRAAHDEHGLAYTICRPFDLYGPPLTVHGLGELAASGADDVPASESGASESGMSYTVADLIAKTLTGQRPLEISGSGERTMTPTHADDVADAIVAAIGAPAGLNEDFNIAVARELTVAELARIVWAACGEAPDELALEYLPPCAVEAGRRSPSVEKAKRLLGWQARIDVGQGIEATVQSMRARGSVGSAT
jgi:UDP-glucose 4-epimerase